MFYLSCTFNGFFVYDDIVYTAHFTSATFSLAIGQITSSNIAFDGFIGGQLLQIAISLALDATCPLKVSVLTMLGSQPLVQMLYWNISRPNFSAAGTRFNIPLGETLQPVEFHFRHCLGFEPGPGDTLRCATRITAALAWLALMDVQLGRSLEHQRRTESQAFFTWVASQQFPLIYLNEVGIYCVFPKEKFGDAEATYNSIRRVPTEWFNKDNSLGLRCTLFKPSIPDESYSLARLHFPAIMIDNHQHLRIFNPYEPSMQPSTTIGEWTIESKVTGGTQRCYRR